MTVEKATSDLRIELRKVQTEVLTLQQQQAQYETVKQELEATLENLTVHREELRVQNEKLQQMQTEIEQSHHKYFDLFEGAPIGYFMLNAQGVILEANITGAEMLGFERKQLIRTRMVQHLKPLYHEAFSTHLDEVFSGPMSDSVELEFEHVGAKPLFVILESVSLPGKDHSVVECRTAMIDITERKRLEIQLHHAQKLESLGVLAGGIAHDFNNLLAAINLNAGLAIRELKLDSSAKIHLDKIEKSALRGGELANQMLSYSGHDTLASHAVNLTELIDEMGDLLEVAISKSAVITYDLSSNLTPIQGDSSKIQQIVLTLITNASEAIAGTSGNITLTTKMMMVNRAYLMQCCFVADLAEGEVVCVEVSDSGIGIDPETMKKMFDPFFSTKFMGRGMGLAALVGIIHAHGGAIHVSSEIGIGTSFRVLFPVNHEQETISTELVSSNIEEDWRQSGLFLVVDDEDDIRIAAEIILGQAGFTVLTAQNGRQAIKLFEEHFADLKGVLLDLTMPHMSGEQVLDAMRTISADVPVILSSGYTEDTVVSRFTEQPFNGFIQKPYPIDMLLAKVKEVLQV